MFSGKIPYLLWLGLVFGMLISLSCRKERILTRNDAQLKFSTDTLTFDTVFTTIGSTTKGFKVFNPYKQTAKVSEIVIPGGSASRFRINVDGVSGNLHYDVEIGPEDSIYVFVEVTVNPSDELAPFILLDSVQFLLNGNRQVVYLMAWGQNAHFHYRETVCNATWTNDKPHVVFGILEVDTPNCQLTIEAGTIIHFAWSSGIFVNEGARIQVNGTKEEQVIFRHIRLEKFYEKLPGQWLGIFLLRGSVQNVFTHAIIENSDYGLSLGSSRDPDFSSFIFANRPQVDLNQVIIRNNYINGLFGFLSEITATNCLIYNSNDFLLALAYGGIYNFKHCTFLNYGGVGINHQKPVALIGTLAEVDNTLFLAEIQANFTNCIIDGSLEEEIELVKVDGEEALLNFTFNHCLLKTKRDPTEEPTKYLECLINTDPKFVNRGEADYHLADSSPCIDAGDPAAGVLVDLDDEPRTGLPDLGAYEFKP